MKIEKNGCGLKVWPRGIMLPAVVALFYLPGLAHAAVNLPPNPALSLSGGHVVVNDDDHHSAEIPQDDVWDKDQPGNTEIPNEGLRVVGKRNASQPATGEVEVRGEPVLRQFTIDATYIPNCPGTLTVSLEGNDGNVKFWEEEQRTKEFTLEKMHVVNNATAGKLKFWVEGIKPTEGFDSIKITAVYDVPADGGSGGSAEPKTSTGTLEFGVVRADVDVDTLNKGAAANIESANPGGVDADSAADQKELSLNMEVYGKLLLANRGDEDGDGVQNAADGITDLGAGEAGQTKKFEKVVIHHDKPWSDEASYTFRYEFSEPKEGEGLMEVPVPEGTEGETRWTVVKRGMRLWLKDGDELRTAAEGNDLVHPDKPVTWAALKARASVSDDTTITLFAEYVMPDEGGDTATRQPIEVAVDMDPDAGYGKVEVDGQEVTVFNSPDARDSANFTLIPVEIAPEVLAVNSDFDEGRIDPATGYAIPDCDDTNIALEAVRNHLDGKFALNERVTDDMHPRFFGVNPSNLGDDFWAGAYVTISKIEKDDPATGHPESGQIRLYGKWGDGPSEYRAIIPYDFDTLAPKNLATGGINGVTGESVYGTASPFPEETSYFIEGVHPGKITLEWRYQKGGIDLKHEQIFEVCTHKNALQWKHDLSYKIRLETSNDPSGEINTIAIMLPGESYKERMERASEYYDFYQDCFLTPLRSKPLHPQAMTWPGLARLAGSQVVGGLSDSEYARRLLEVGSISGYVLPGQIQDELLTWSLSETKDLQQALFTGARTIFQSIGWQMHAYRSSGYRALDWVAEETGEIEVDALVTAGVWKDLRKGILNHDKALLDNVALIITAREQNVTIIPTWSVISGLFGGTTDWMFSVLGQNSCTPSGLDFLDVFPITFVHIPPMTTPVAVMTGSLASTTDRWIWIEPGTLDGILDTWNKHPLAARDSLVRNTLEQDARRFSRVHQIAYQFPNYLYLPIWVWDNEDVP
jgi:hypothetical protein